MFDYFVLAVLIGTGATAVIDLWAIIRKQVFGIPPMNFALVGRWLAYLPRGRFFHNPIAASPPVQGELMIGWIAHYLIGMAFAAILLAVSGLSWAHRPTVIPALIVGLVSVTAPFLLMQPGMGAGIAGSRTPRPGAARIQSLVTHAIFGLGLYATAWLANFLMKF